MSDATTAVAARVQAILAGAPADPVEIDTLLTQADSAYYEEDHPLLDDGSYDRLSELARQRTGQTHQALGEVSGALVAIPHAYPTLSLQKAYTVAEVREFKVAAVRALGRDDAPDDLALCIEPKIDGLTLVLQYTGGQLVRALTRGNGRVGEDVTHNVRGLEGVPERIAETGTAVYVRGEAYLPLGRFAALQAAGEDVATARNTAAGDLRRKSSTADVGNRARAHGVTFLAYAIEGDGMEEALPSQPAVYTQLAQWDFVVPEYRVATEGPAADETLEAPTTETGRAIADLHETIAGADFAVDGVVLKVANRAWQRRLGATEKTPRWAIAYKRLGAEYETTVRGVQWQVGRVGAVTPVLIADPVDMDGAQVTHYTAHHAAFYRALGAAVGTRIVVTRAGDVIPKVLRLAVGQQRDEALPIPETCPSCGAALVWRNGKVVECHNAACPPKLRRGLDHFAARDNMDIEGLGRELIEALVSGALVRSPADLYRLSAEQLAAVPLANGQLYGSTRAVKLAAAIAASRAKPYGTVLHALGMPGVGYPECRTIAAHFSLTDLLARGRGDTLQADLLALYGIGAATAASVGTFLTENAAWLEELETVGLRVEADAPPQDAKGPLAGGTFVVTGALEMGSREDVEDWIRAHGGAVSSSVSSHTSYLVTGAKPGAGKVKAAAKQGVPSVSEAELRAMVAEPPDDPAAAPS